MNERQEILQAWNQRSAVTFRSPQFMKAQAFFQLVNDEQSICWDDLVTEFRRNYYDAFDEIVPTLLATNDPLIIFHVAKFADLQNPKEANLAKTIIQTMDVQKHEATMQLLANNTSLQPELLKKGLLPDSVRVVMGLAPRALAATEVGAAPSAPVAAAVAAAPVAAAAAPAAVAAPPAAPAAAPSAASVPAPGAAQVVAPATAPVATHPTVPFATPPTELKK
jgi:hypothetical protein